MTLDSITHPFCILPVRSSSITYDKYKSNVKKIVILNKIVKDEKQKLKYLLIRMKTRIFHVLILSVKMIEVPQIKLIFDFFFLKSNFEQIIEKQLMITYA